MTEYYVRGEDADSSNILTDSISGVKRQQVTEKTKAQFDEDLKK